MNEVDFRNWMTSKGINKKVQSDCIGVSIRMWT